MPSDYLTIQDQKKYEEICQEKTLSILTKVVGQEGTSNPRIIFAKVWGELFSDSEFMFALSMSKIKLFQSFQLNQKERLHLLIALKIHDLGFNFRPKILLHDDQYIQSVIALKKSSMLLAVHDGFALAAAVLLHYGQRVSTITSDPYIGNTLWRTGVRPDQIELITNDFRSLERVRASMAGGAIPALCIDYPNENRVFTFISPKMFDFGIKRGISIFFVKKSLGDDGTVHIYMDALKSTLDPVADAKLFLDFVMSGVSDPNKKYTIRY